MRKTGDKFRTIWQHPENPAIVQIIDQRKLPHEYVVTDLVSWQEGATAIQDMLVRGAPLIGATAAWSLYLAAIDAAGNDDNKATVLAAADALEATRPTAINLRWALDEMMRLLEPLSENERSTAAYKRAADICDEDVDICSSIGDHGLRVIQDLSAKKGPGETVNILTHCNAGWLATVDWGTALAPIYKAFDAGVPVHVWVDETRPRNQGASLTAWELGRHGVPLTVIADNAGGHLMQEGRVDMCITGTDRTTAAGDVCNKIGTYLKALAADDNNVPFYVALPSPTIDWTIEDGRDIPIEERAAEEVTRIQGKTETGDVVTVEIVPEGAKGGNPAFDVTPARLVTGLITERGICDASKEGLAELFPEKG